MFRNLLLATAFAVTLVPSALAESLRDLSVEPQTPPQAYPGNTGGLAAEAWFDRADSTYALGETVRLFVRTHEDAYVTALSIGPRGAVTQIFPNALHPNNCVRAYAQTEIPGWGARAVVTGSVGPEVVKVIVTRRPVQVVPEAQLGAASPFRSVFGGVGSVVRDLETIADAPGQDMVILDKTFVSVAPDYPTGPSAILIVPSAGWAPSIGWTATDFYPLPAVSP